MAEAILDGTARVLADHGVARLTTNLVAEVAGVSIGSVYQYFENKEALLRALHVRHSTEMQRAATRVLRTAAPLGLRESIRLFTHALLHAHLVEPALHRALERLFPFMSETGAATDHDLNVHRHVLNLMEQYRGEISRNDLDVAAWFTIHTVHALVHQAILYPPGGADTDQLELSITDAVMGYLCPNAASLERN